MKKITFISAMLLLAASGFISCKKENTEEDLTVLFKNTVWTGEIKYNNKAIAEPYVISFDGNGNFQWEEYGGSYAGAYTLDKTAKTITLLFAGSTTKFTAAITTEKKWGTITHGGTYSWTVVNGELRNSSEQSLENTIWKGNYDNGSTLQISFVAGSKVNLPPGSSYFFPYTKSKETIRFGLSGVNAHFLVLTSKSKIKGLRGDGGTGYLGFELSKQ